VGLTELGWYKSWTWSLLSRATTAIGVSSPRQGIYQLILFSQLFFLYANLHYVFWRLEAVDTHGMLALPVGRGGQQSLEGMPEAAGRARLMVM